MSVCITKGKTYHEELWDINANSDIYFTQGSDTINALYKKSFSNI